VKTNKSNPILVNKCENGFELVFQEFTAEVMCN